MRLQRNAHAVQLPRSLTIRWRQIDFLSTYHYITVGESQSFLSIFVHPSYLRAQKEPLPKQGFLPVH